jgi:hypothetical protein
VFMHKRLRAGQRCRVRCGGHRVSDLGGQALGSATPADGAVPMQCVAPSPVSHLPPRG